VYNYILVKIILDNSYEYIEFMSFFSKVILEKAYFT